MQEEWRKIPSFGLYSASSLGRIRRDATIVQFDKHTKSGVRRRYPDLIMKLHTNPDGYQMVGLIDDQRHRTNVFVARMIAFAFLPNPENLPEVDHIDRNPANNVVSNLRWCSRSENNRNRIFQSNTGQQHITREVVERFVVYLPNRKKRYFSTLEAAISYRDASSSMQQCRDTSPPANE